MPVDGSDIPLGMLNISLKLPLLETQQLMMNQSRSFRPPNATAASWFVFFQSCEELTGTAEIKSLTIRRRTAGDG